MPACAQVGPLDSVLGAAEASRDPTPIPTAQPAQPLQHMPDPTAQPAQPQQGPVPVPAVSSVQPPQESMPIPAAQLGQPGLAGPAAGRLAGRGASNFSGPPGPPSTGPARCIPQMLEHMFWPMLAAPGPCPQLCTRSTCQPGLSCQLLPVWRSPGVRNFEMQPAAAGSCLRTGRQLNSSLKPASGLLVFQPSSSQLHL